MNQYIKLLGKFEYRCLSVDCDEQSNLDNSEESNDDSEVLSSIENNNTDEQDEISIQSSQISDYSLGQDSYYVRLVKLSENQQYIAFDVKKSDSSSDSYFHLLFDIQTQTILYQEETNYYYLNFTFTSDSKYFIYNKANKIYLIELETMQNQELIDENFTELLTVDSKNNIYIRNNNYLYLYSIESKVTSSFIINESIKDEFISQAYKLHSDLIFLITKESNYIIHYPSNKIIQKQRNQEDECDYEIFQNLFILEWDLEVDQIYLSNLKTRKLIRKFINNQEGSSSIYKNKNSIYKYFFFDESENTHTDQRYQRINLLTDAKINLGLNLGKYKQLIQEKIIMTDSLLIIIDSFKFRFFKYNLEQIEQI